VGDSANLLGGARIGESKYYIGDYTVEPENGGLGVFAHEFGHDLGLPDVNEPGALIDNIAISAGRSFSLTDGAEAGDNGWSVLGWKVSTGTETQTSPRYYLMENRQYVGYDATLETGLYQFSEGITRPDWVEHFPFQDGMLVWYVNHAYADNNVSAHAGFGNAMVVDARPLSLTYPDGTRPSNRRQPFDATFGLQATDEVCLHKQVADSSAAGYSTAAACAPSVAGIATFDDSDPEAYWSSVNPQNSVKVAGLGVTATVVSEEGGVLTVQVHNPPA